MTGWICVQCPACLRDVRQDRFQQHLKTDSGCKTMRARSRRAIEAGLDNRVAAELARLHCTREEFDQRLAAELAAQALTRTT